MPAGTDQELDISIFRSCNKQQAKIQDCSAVDSRQRKLPLSNPDQNRKEIEQVSCCWVAIAKNCKYVRYSVKEDQVYSFKKKVKSLLI